MNLEKLAGNTGVKKTYGSLNREISGIACDSRKVQKGFLFVAIDGHQQHGGDFTADALRRGAVAVLAEKKSGLAGVTELLVPDARRALAEVSAAFYGWPARKLETFGITGTNGKTTTGFMIKSILSSAGRKPGLLGTVRYEIGDRWIPASRTTPESVDVHEMLRRMADFECSSVVLEVSSHSLVQQRVWGIDFNVGVFTNLTPEHLSYHENMDNYFAAKRRLFQWMEQQEQSGIGVINVDDEWGRRLCAESHGLNVVSFGLGTDAEVRAENIRMTMAGSAFDVHSPWGELKVRIRMPGRFNVYNALGAFSACAVRGVPLEKIGQGLELLESVPGRLDRVRNRKGKTVFIDYAHTEDALRSVLGCLREIAAGRIVTVFGCGGCRDTEKRPAMGRVAAELSDYSIITTDNPRKEEPGAIAAQIMEGFLSPDQYEVELDREKAIARGLELVGRKDILLVAGKGHENYQEFADVVLPFEDRETVERLLDVRRD